MSDWPGTTFVRPFVCTVDSRSGMLGSTLVYGKTAVTTTTVWGAANRAIYVPVEVQQPVTIYQLCITVGTQSGNVDVGVYDEQGKRIVSAGSTACAAAGIQVVNVTDTYLVPGVYFLALSCDNTTAAFLTTSATPALAQVQALGLQQQALGSVTLPDPATFANPASPVVPWIYASTMQATI